MTARWEEVLDIALDFHNWCVGNYGRMFGEGYFADAFRTPRAFPGAEPEGDRTWRSEDHARMRGREWIHALGVHTFNAEPIWVEPDMMSVVENAVSHFVPEPLMETDLITPNGFLVLPRSLWLDDPSGNHLSWKAAVWWPAGTGIHLTLLHDIQDRDDVDLTDDELREKGWTHTSRFLPTHVVNWGFGEMHPGVDPKGLVTTPTGADVLEPDREDGRAVRIAHTGTAVRGDLAHAQLQGAWRLLTQYLAVHSKQRPPRAQWKRAQKAKMPTEHVTIVRLRRPPQEKQEPGDPQVVNWTKRWMVGGHWRNQWYSSLGVHRQIWISPFVKGPADMPLVVNKARVFEFVR